MIRSYNPTLRIGPKASVSLSSISPYATPIPITWYETNEKMYAYGGANGTGAKTVIHKSVYSTEVTTAISGVLPVARSNIAAVGNANQGYAVGGQSNATSLYKNVYASETISALTSISTGFERGGGSGTSTKAYAGGGATSYNSSPRSRIYGIPHSTDTSAEVATAALTTARELLEFGHSKDHCYYGPGLEAKKTTDRMPFSTETTALISATHISENKYQYALVHSTTNMYYCGGSDSPRTFHKMPFATDTFTSISAVFSVDTTTPGYSQSDTKGVILGGYTTGYASTGLKFDMTTDSLSTVAGLSLTLGLADLRGAG